MRKLRRSWLRLLVDIRSQRELDAMYATRVPRRKTA